MGRKRSAKEVHKQSLAQQIENPESHGVRVYPHKKLRRKSSNADDEGEIGQDQSAAILTLAREQQQEEEREAARARSGADTGALAAAVQRSSRNVKADSDSEDESPDGSEWEVNEDEFDDAPDIFLQGGDAASFDAADAKILRSVLSMRGDTEAYADGVLADEHVFNQFMQPAAGGAGPPQTLADIIMAKMQQKNAAAAVDMEEYDATNAASTSGMDDTLVQVYTDVGKILRRYTTGKLPKAFKIVPHLQNWEEVVFMMEPQSWSPHATFAATKMFVSQLNAKQVQRFLNLVLLNKVRDDIREHKRLHFALFQAVKKAVFKAGAFYKGFVLPLLKAGDCTLREAVIISSVLTRVSIPVDHSAAALLRMADMPYSGVTSFFMKTILDKKYALPYRVIDALVDHYVSFHKEERTLPVIWHLCLLTFVQRYKHEIRNEDKECLRKLLKAQHHHGVSPEILRELNHGRSRGDKAAEDAGMGLHVHIAGHTAEDVFNMAPVQLEEMEF